MLRSISKHISIIAATALVSCVPLEYVEPSPSSYTEAKRSSGERDFYFEGVNDPIKLQYNNGIAKGQVLYQIDDPYVDLYISKEKRSTGISANEEMFSKQEISECLEHYINAQKAVIEDKYALAVEEIDLAIELIELQEFYDLKGSVYYLTGDTTTANYFWNYLTNKK